MGDAVRVMTKANLKNILTVVRDIINRSFANAIRKAQSAEKQARNARLAANASQTTANNARATANTAQAAADKAQTTANAAQKTADVAQVTANNAQTAAKAAQTAADNAKTAADKAQTTANAAVTPSPVQSGGDACLYPMYNPYANYKTTVVGIGSRGGSALNIKVNEKCPSVVFEPPVYLYDQADFEFRRASSAYRHPLITGIGGIVVYSSTPKSTKKFKITVDDNGTLSATEITQ